MSDLEYFDDSIGAIVVPKGFKTSKHTLPSVLHDYLCKYGCKYGVSHKQADKIFYDEMIKSGASKFVVRSIKCLLGIKRLVDF